MDKRPIDTPISPYPQCPDDERIQNLIEEHTTCCLCGTHLVFQHKTDFLLHRVEEQAHCPVCQIRNTPTNHTLQ